jgi:trans-2,3-dihydro-3-hydroxyanthranilate isomerase
MRYLLLDVFTDRPFTGNPLAVFPDPAGLSDRQMQGLAAELNLSESVFLFPPAGGGTAAVRIFTPQVELPFAGHPTLGAAAALLLLGRATDRVVLEEGVGPVPVRVTRRDDITVEAELTAARPPEVGPAPAGPAELAAALGLTPGDLDPDRPARAVDAGVPYTVLPVRDLATLGRAEPAAARWRAVVGDGSVYVVTFDPAVTGDGPEADVRARMFAPALGVVEDPATGSAAVALVGYLHELGLTDRPYVVAQGVEMGRPSRLTVRADVTDGAVRASYVSGASVLLGSGVFDRLP